jgi:hypothetical protein
MKIFSIVVEGRKWFDKVNGNTYHCANVIVTTDEGVKVLKAPYQYGYGDQYLYSAFDELEKAGIAKLERYKESGGTQAPWSWAQKHGVTLVYSAVNVAKKKDLQ